MIPEKGKNKAADSLNAGNGADTVPFCLIALEMGGVD